MARMENDWCGNLTEFGRRFRLNSGAEFRKITKNILLGSTSEESLFDIQSFRLSQVWAKMPEKT